MNAYPTIDYYGDHWGLPIYAFDKLDGSNIRFEYSRKRGFYKFGSRNVLIDRTHDLGPAIDVFLNKYNEGLSKIFGKKEYRDIQSIVCYGEFLGKNSAFGAHDPNDEFDVVLFDVELHKKGFIPPKEFVSNFEELGIPTVVYHGNLNKEFVKDIKDNVYNLSEGVICKGVVKGRKEQNNLYYCKIKSNDWFARLRNKDPELYALELKQYGQEIDI